MQARNFILIEVRVTRSCSHSISFKEREKEKKKKVIRQNLHSVAITFVDRLQFKSELLRFLENSVILNNVILLAKTISQLNSLSFIRYINSMFFISNTIYYYKSE